jgi:hypothetical protein
VSLDHWKSTATDAQTLVVTCEDGWAFLYTVIIYFFGDHIGHRHEAFGRTLKLPAGKIRKWEDNV